MPNKEPPNFALLIGKRLDNKDSPSKGLSEKEPPKDSEHEKMETSAIKAFFDHGNAGDYESAKQALCDFLEMELEEYNGDEESDSSDDQGEY